jgi:hypothetical protein
MNNYRLLMASVICCKNKKLLFVQVPEFKYNCSFRRYWLHEAIQFPLQLQSARYCQKMSVVLVLILSLLATYFVYHRRFYLLLLKIPATRFPIRIFMKSILRFDINDLFRKVTDILNKFNGLGVVWVLHKPIVCVTLPEDLKIVLNSEHCQLKPSYIRLLFGEHTENMLFGSQDVWRSHRRILNPYFTSQSMPSLFPMLKERVKVMMKMMEKKEQQGEFNIFNVMTATSLETTLSVMELEVDIQSLSEEKRDAFSQGLVR